MRLWTKVAVDTLVTLPCKPLQIHHLRCVRVAWLRMLAAPRASRTWILRVIVSMRIVLIRRIKISNHLKSTFLSDMLCLQRENHSHTCTPAAAPGVGVGGVQGTSLGAECTNTIRNFAVKQPTSPFNITHQLGRSKCCRAHHP